MAKLTVIWNQRSYPMSAEYRTVFNSKMVSGSFNNNEGTITWITSANGGYNCAFDSARSAYQRPCVIYLAYDLYTTVSNGMWGFEIAGVVSPDPIKVPANVWTRVAFIHTITGTGTGNEREIIPNLRNGSKSKDGDIATVKNHIIVNLTQMFGAGNEPTTVQEFENQCKINGVDLSKYQPVNIQGTERVWYTTQEPNYSEMEYLRKRVTANEPHVNTATGKMISFTTDTPTHAKECKVTLLPMQSGSGDPSPSNIRSINGFNGTTLNVSSTFVDGTRYTVNWQSTAGTVYGGCADLVNGMLTQEWAYAEYDGSNDEDWKVQTLGSGKYNFYIMTPSAWKRDTRGSSDLICNVGKSTSSSLGTGDVCITNTGNFNAFLGPLTGATTVQEFRNWLSEHIMQVVCRFQLPIVHSITPQEIKILRGVNNIWTGDDTDVTIEYWTHVGDAQTCDIIGGIPVYVNNMRMRDGGSMSTKMYENSEFFLAGIVDTGSSGSKSYSVSRWRGMSAYASLRLFDTQDLSGDCVDFWSTCQTEYEYGTYSNYNFTSDGRYIVVTVPKAFADQFYLRYKNGAYLLKGKNVT